MSLQTLIDKSVEKMGAGIHPVVKASAIEMIRRAYNEGIFVKITHGYRSMEEQAALYGQGRSSYVYNGKQYGNKKAVKVTNAKPGSSYHNFGLAIDFVLTNKDGTAAYWTVNDKWRRVAEIAKGLGFVWGGDWSSFKDNPHLEMTGGLTTSHLRAGHKPDISIKYTAVGSVTDKKEEEDMSGTFSPSTPILKERAQTVLSRFSNKPTGALDKAWADKLKKDELTDSDMIGLIYNAVYNSHIGNIEVIDQLKKENQELKERIEKLENPEGLQ